MSAGVQYPGLVTDLPKVYATIWEIERDNYNFFSPDTMRFFNSRVSDVVYKGNLFVTSEKYDHRSPRLYTIRQARGKNCIETIGEFQQYRTSSAAHRAARKISEEVFCKKA